MAAWTGGYAAPGSEQTGQEKLMSAPIPEKPSCRGVQIHPDPSNPDRYIIQDPAGLLPGVLEMSRAAVVLLSLCDGSNDLAAIAKGFEERVGRELEPQEVIDFVQKMDELYLLDSPRFQDLKRQEEEEFRAKPWREAAHAGGAYDADAATLSKSLDLLMTLGKPARSDRNLVSLIAPHIDLRRGGATYGRAYSALKGRQRPEVVVIFGTAHASASHRFILCEKGFRTPCGDLPYDAEFGGRLKARLTDDCVSDVLVHKAEHSIEFQAVFLAHLFAPEPPPRIVPILCTSLDDCMGDGQRPEEVPEVERFMQAFQATYDEEKRPVLVIAGADFSHVGAQFGGPVHLTTDFLQEVRGRDVRSAEAAAAGDAKEFFSSVAEHRNGDRICSVGAIYSTLRMVRAPRGELLDYDQAVSDDGSGAVTFGGIALYDELGGRGLGIREPDQV